MAVKGSFHQHYHFIRQLAGTLQKSLAGAVLNDAFSLSKQELVLLFTRDGNPFVIKVIAKFHAGFLLFEHTPYSKGSNALACFESLYTEKVKDVEPHLYNRSFAIRFEHGAQLIFKCYDALINVIAVDNGEVSDVFRESIQNDWTYHDAEFSVTDHNIIEKLNAISVTEGTFYLYKNSAAYYLALNETADELVLQTNDALDASTVFARYQLNVATFEQAKLSRIATLEGEIKKYRQQIKLSEQSIKQLVHESPFEETGHLIMANLHVIKPGVKEAELFNFYTNKNIKVKLKQDLSAADNAAYYYRKAKNKKIELEQMEQKLLSMRQKLVRHEELLQQVRQAENSKQLKPLQLSKKQQEIFPFKKFTFKDFEIWVGKTAANNDLLTQKYAHKNDLWLHAKGVSGSHTVIRHKAGKPFTSDVITYAAQVAAYYSKNKGNALAAVTYTLKKFVRKPKGSEPGQVVVDREEVVMVEPKIA